MALCKQCFLSRWKGVLVILILFVLLNAFIYNIYTKYREETFAFNIDMSDSIQVVPDVSVTLTPLAVKEMESLVKELGLQRNDWMYTAIMNPFSYNFVHNQENACRNKTIDLIIAVPVSRNHFDQRKTVRETWGNYSHDPDLKSILLFFLGNGTPGEPPDIQKSIDNESSEHSDIIQVDYTDSYRNLSIKSMSILKWIDAYCPHTEFLTKADDDMYIHIPRLLTRLNNTRISKNIKHFILGSQIQGAVPVQDKKSKWYTPKKDFAEKQYPVYVSGTSYSMPGVTARSLFLAALRTPLFWLEDIYITGLCSRKVGVPVINDNTVTYSKPAATGCNFINKFTTGHRYTMVQIRKIHEDLQNKHLLCSKQANKTTKKPK